jgi:nucleotide-binding universal stress UspA family protein
MTGCLLVPLDGSTVSKRALPYASALATASKRRLQLLRILTPRQPHGAALVQETQALAELEQVANGLRQQGIEVESELSSSIFGDVAEVIVGCAEHDAAELIVMATHGHNGLGGALHQSVAERVLRRATMPVLVVPAACNCPWTVDLAPLHDASAGVVRAAGMLIAARTSAAGVVEATSARRPSL